ncbi:MAG: diaminopimelate epimerase [Candidatus Sericytochromatia bacterium]|nr:diaminopimelate epimerase [Candidatus Sericytochromatia bacterium]
MTLRFWKYQGTANDFILLEATSELQALDWVEWAPRLCDRHRGVGADGILLLSSAESPERRMRVINADGSEPEMCGNGLRCAVRWWFDQGSLPSDTLVTVQTGAGPREAVCQGDGQVRLAMGQPGWRRADIPMLGPAAEECRGEPVTLEGQTLPMTAVSMGNPHAVLLVPDAQLVPLSRWGPLLERDPRFPQRTNVEFISVINPAEIRMQVWERGVGATMACGTGACAAAVVVAREGLVNRQVAVHLPGGTLHVTWAEDDAVWLTGPADHVFSGQVDLAGWGARLTEARVLGRPEVSPLP